MSRFYGSPCSNNGNARNVNVCGVSVIVKSQIKSYIEIFKSFGNKWGQI